MTARGVFDLRFWVSADDELDVWTAATMFQRLASEAAEILQLENPPAEVDVRYIQIRDGSRTRGFEATMGKKPRRKARRA